MLYKQRWRHLPLPIEKKKVFYVTRYTSRFLMHLGVSGLFCKFCISLVFFLLSITRTSVLVVGVPESVRMEDNVLLERHIVEQQAMILSSYFRYPFET